MKSIKLFGLSLVALLTLSSCQSQAPGEVVDDIDHATFIHSDEDFLAHMIPHHQEAIDSSLIILEKSENEDLRDLAQTIVDAQSAEIEQMEAWGLLWVGEEFAASSDYEAMMPDLTVLEGEELDQAFLEGMIEHHRMAVDMAEGMLLHSIRPEIIQMSEAIIETQTEEIDLMKSWLEQ